MRNLFNRLTGRVRDCLIAGLVGFGIGSMIVGPIANALTIPPSFGPRQFPDQMKHYVRITVPFNGCTYVSLTCSFKVGAIPYNSFVTSGWVQVLSTFTGATTMTASVGTASAGAQIINAANILTAGAGAAATIVPANIGEAATGNGIAQTGTNGGFDLWVTLTATVAIPTAGLAVIIIEYVPPNDGGCVLVPLGATATGC